MYRRAHSGRLLLVPRAPPLVLVSERACASRRDARCWARRAGGSRAVLSMSTSSAWRAAAAVMDSAAAGASVSPLSVHSFSGDEDVPQLSPAGLKLLSSPVGRGSGARAEEGPPPVLVRAPPHRSRLRAVQPPAGGPAPRVRWAVHLTRRTLRLGSLSLRVCCSA